MLTRALALATLLGSLAPGMVAAQAVGFGGRVGTLGLGGEIAVDLTDRVVARGGVGVVPYDPTLTFGDLDVTLTLPTVYNVGVDLYVTGAMRIGGGVLFRSSDPEVTGTFTAPQQIGGTTFTPEELGTLRGVFDASDRAPYVLVGFGRHTQRGSGLFIDLGVAFVGEPDVRLGTSGGTLSDDTDPLRSALDAEAAEFEEDMRGYLRLWPILSIGFRFGV